MPDFSNILSQSNQVRIGTFIRTTLYTMWMDEHGRYVLIGIALVLLLIMYIFMGKAESTEREHYRGGYSVRSRRKDPDYW